MIWSPKKVQMSMSDVNRTLEHPELIQILRNTYVRPTVRSINYPKTACQERDPRHITYLCSEGLFSKQYIPRYLPISNIQNWLSGKHISLHTRDLCIFSISRSHLAMYLSHGQYFLTRYGVELLVSQRWKYLGG